MKPKAELMRNSRANRKKQGLVELRAWLAPKHKDRVLRYLCFLTEIEHGCFCEKQSIGVTGKSCGDCPRDYAAAQFIRDV